MFLRPWALNVKDVCTLLLDFVILTTIFVIVNCVSNDTCVQYCFCSDSEGLMECLVPDTLSQVPLRQTAEQMSEVTELIIKNQSNLTELTTTSLQNYTELEYLTIENCSISYIAPNAFANNKQLRVLSFDRNRLRHLSWKVFNGIHPLSIDIGENPLECYCGVLWIQSLQRERNDLLSPRSDRLICYDYSQSKDGDPVERLIQKIELPNCETPSVTIEQTEINVDKDDDFVVKCEAVGTPEPEVRWDTSNMVSNFTVVRDKNGRSEELHVHKVRSRDSGWIDCIGSSIAGRTSETLTLLVNSAPEIIQLTEPLKKFHYCIDYEVIGVPTPNVTWLKNDMPLQETLNLHDIVISQTLSSIKGCLVFKMNNIFNVGTYTLIASNSHGSVNRSVDADFKVHPYTEDFPLTMDPRIADYPPIVYPHDSEQTTKPAEDNTVIYVATGVAVFLIVLFMVSLFYGLRRYQKKMSRTPNEPMYDRKSKCPFFKLSKKRKKDGPTPREAMPLTAMHIVENPNYYPKGHRGQNTECRPKSSSEKQKTIKENSGPLIEIERKRLKVEKERLFVEQKRLQLEERRLRLEKQRLKIKTARRKRRLCQCLCVSISTTF